MVNKIWLLFILIGSFFMILTGNVASLNEQFLKGGLDGIKLLWDMMPLLVLWSGIMNNAQESGLLDKFANLMKPFLKKLFPSLPSSSKALGYIASNIAANGLGLGSAATPFGLKAMAEMQKDNPKQDEATPAMVTFLILNTAGVTIIPTTVIAMRSMYHSANPSEIIITGVLATICSSIAGLLFDYFKRRRL